MLPVSPREVRQSNHALNLPDDPITQLPLSAGTYHFSLPLHLLHSGDHGI
jgi:hypothetical protein